MYKDKATLMNELENYISTFFGVSGSDIKNVASYFKPQSLQKGEYLLKPGKIGRFLSFQRSGLIRFYTNSQDAEVTQWISDSGNFVTDLSGLVFDLSSRTYIQALTDCKLFTISKEDYSNIGHIIPKWHELEKLFIARAFLFMEERIFSLLSMSAEERYHWLLNHNPSLFQYVPLQYLASMMGMTPETLSRIRRKNLNT